MFYLSYLLDFFSSGQILLWKNNERNEICIYVCSKGRRLHESIRDYVKVYVREYDEIETKRY